jgi:hypothetical protein
MDDKSALLHQLRIDRGGEQQPSGKKRLILLAGLICVIIIGAATWFWMRPAPLGVHVAVARPM